MHGGIIRYNTHMNTNTQLKRPYFLWDYDLTDGDVRRILAGDNETERQWMMGRILTNARYEDVWKYLRVSDIVHEFPYLRMRREVKEAWRYAFTVWGYHV